MYNPSDLPHLSILFTDYLLVESFIYRFNLPNISKITNKFVNHEDVHDAFPLFERKNHYLDGTLYHKLFLNNELLA